MDSGVHNLLVTYTEPGPRGHTLGNLAFDPLPYDSLPGFIGRLPDEETPQTLVISLGFETLGLRALLEGFRDRRGGVRFILPFPNSGTNVGRQWKNLATLVAGRSADLASGDLRSIPPWDTEEVVTVLERWGREGEPLALAPFGPKPHTIAMTLYACKHDCGLYYTQPKAYAPDYTSGVGKSSIYVLKHDGVSCLEEGAPLES